ncbi:MAG: ROK family protein, partial [Monoglobales bacterium]
MNIGVDIGGMSAKAGLVDDLGKIIYKASVPTGPDRKMPELVHDIGLLVDGVIRNSGVSKDEIKSVGFGVPGACNPSEGKVI